jgi:hypothetical protein
MLTALQAFATEYPESRADWAGSWIYRTDAEKCFVFVQHVCCLHPPSYAGYVVRHRREGFERLGGWQFHWGIDPRHAVAQYEAYRAAGLRGPCGLVLPDEDG